MAQKPPAGWYPNPDDDTQLRWWDGKAWTDDTSPGPLATAAGDVAEESTPETTLTVAAAVTPAPSARRSPGVSTWIVGVVAALVSVSYGIALGFGAFLVTLSLFVLPTAIVALASRRRTWMRFPQSTPMPRLFVILSASALLLGSIVSAVPSDIPQSTAASTGAATAEPTDSITLVDYTGDVGTSAAEHLAGSGLKVRMVTEDGSAAPDSWDGWIVVDESPAAGAVVSRDDTVTITLRAPSTPTPTPTATPEPAPEAPAPPAPPAPAAPEAPAPPPAQESGPLVTPGAFCADAQRGVVGHSAAGKTYVCGGKGPDANGHLHWNTH